jgi:hypothetical protein
MKVAAVRQAAARGFEDYDPGAVAAAVNGLQPLGKEGALGEIEGYLESSTADDFGLFWVLRVLFDVSEDVGFPPVLIGQPTFPPPQDPRKLPRFPVALVSDVPLLVVRGYDLAGLAEPVQAHVDYFREHGEVRERPLEPAADPKTVEAEFEELWRDAYGGEYLGQAIAIVGEQLARM